MRGNYVVTHKNPRGKNEVDGAGQYPLARESGIGDFSQKVKCLGRNTKYWRSSAGHVASMEGMDRPFFLPKL